MTETAKIIVISRDNKVIQTDKLIYTPIKNLIFGWSIDCSTKSKWLQTLYSQNENRDSIVGLVVDKETGEWSFCVDE